MGAGGIGTFGAVPLGSGGGGGGSSNFVVLGQYHGDGTTGTYTLSSIPATSESLEIAIVGRSTVAAVDDTVNMQFNGDTTAGHYIWSQLYGSGFNLAPGPATITGQGSASDTNDNIGYLPGTGSFYSAPGTTRLWLPNYHRTAFQKGGNYLNAMPYTNTGGAITVNGSFTWLSTAAITQVEIYLSSGALFSNGTVITVLGTPG